MKSVKSVFLLVLILIIIVTSTPTLAGTDGGFVNENDQLPSGEPPYIMMFSELEGKYIPYENPNYPRINESMNKPSSKSRSYGTLSDFELGITLERKSYNVYTTPGGTTTVGTIGSSKSREIVRVYSEIIVNGEKWYYITYKTSTSTKSGYIKAAFIDIPSRIYNYSKVLTSGTWSCDHGYGGHAGVDIAGDSLSVYSFTSAESKFYYDKYKHPDDDKDYLISYGNYVQQSTSLGTAVYAHLSSFNGFTASSLPSKRISQNDEDFDKSRYTKVFVGSKDNVSAGELLGETGSTGNSSKPHLHFEISGKDPFKYVLFPDYGYVA